MKTYGYLILLLVLCSCDFKDQSPILQDVLNESESPREDRRADIPSCQSYCDTQDKLLNNFSEYDFLSFKNFGYRGIGRCRGHALVTQKLSFLAKFNEKDTSCVNSSYESSCANLAIEEIDKVLDFKARFIRGFPSMLELSKHPKIKAHLMMRVSSISHRYNARNIDIVDRGHDNYHIDTFYELKHRIFLNHQSYIALNGEGLGDHALLSYEHRFNDYGEVICVRDSNYIPKHGLKCESFLFINGYDIYYKRADLNALKLYEFSIMTDENNRVSKYQFSQKKFCQNHAHQEGKCRL